MAVDAARLRLVDVRAGAPPSFGAEARAARAASAARWTTSVVGPTGLEWRLRILRVPRAMTPPPPSEMLAHADPVYGWTPLPLGVVLAPLALLLLPVVSLLRSLGLVSWTLEARTYPWGRRYPPVVLMYAVRGREQAFAALAELASALTRGGGGPVLARAERID